MRKSYRVVWEIDVYAEDPVVAAKKAWEVQHDKFSFATFFTVKEVELGMLGKPIREISVTKVDLEDHGYPLTPED